MQGKIVQTVRKGQKNILAKHQKYFPEHDFLNIRPLDEKVIPSIYRKIWLWGIIPAGIFGFIFRGNLIFNATIPIFWFVGGIVIYGIWLGIINKKSSVWYFNAPIPVKIPHDFKVGDIVDLDIKIEKIKEVDKLAEN